jgi:DNA polymerase-3 subunit gamma/tau
VVRLATQPDGDDVARLLARLDALERRLSSGGGGPAPSDGAPPSRGGGAIGNGKTGAKPRARKGDAAAAPTANAAPTPSRAAPTPQATHGEAAVGETAPASASVLDRFRAFARNEEPGLYAALDDAEFVEKTAGHLRIRVSAGFSERRLREKNGELDALAERFFSQPTHVEVETGEVQTGPGTPGVAEDAEAEARQRRQDALNDPAVGRALDILGADIVEIRPLGGSR